MFTATGECIPGLICPIAIDGCVVLGGDCDEVNDVCVDIADDDLCDDGLFCNGAETCDINTRSCIAATNPCPAGSTCNDDSDTCDIADQKVTICHIPPGNPDNAKTKTIGGMSVANHLGHGDFLGPCL